MTRWLLLLALAGCATQGGPITIQGWTIKDNTVVFCPFRPPTSEQLRERLAGCEPRPPIIQSP